MKVGFRIGQLVIVEVGGAVVGPWVPEVLVVHLLVRDSPDLALVDVAQHRRPVELSFGFRPRKSSVS